MDRIPRDLTRRTAASRSCSISARLTKSGGVARNAPVWTFDWHFGATRLSQKSRTSFVPRFPSPLSPPLHFTLQFHPREWSSSPSFVQHFFSSYSSSSFLSTVPCSWMLWYVVSLIAFIKRWATMLRYRSKSTKTIVCYLSTLFFVRASWRECWIIFRLVSELLTI